MKLGAISRVLTFSSNMNQVNDSSFSIIGIVHPSFEIAGGRKKKTFSVVLTSVALTSMASTSVALSSMALASVALTCMFVFDICSSQRDCTAAKCFLSTSASAVLHHQRHLFVRRKRLTSLAFSTAFAFVAEIVLVGPEKMASRTKVKSLWTRQVILLQLCV